jgi:hypothetical protein
MKKKILTISVLLTLSLTMGCNDDDVGVNPSRTPDNADSTVTPTDSAMTPTDSTNASQTISVGVFLLNGSTYSDANKDLVFKTGEACQTWSRTAQGDKHSSSSHDHFNAAKNVTYDATTSTITWHEYGPETTQEDIDATCSKGENGAVKTANSTDYSKDKNFYLQIKKID